MSTGTGSDNKPTKEEIEAFEEFLYEIEGYGLRCERIVEDIKPAYGNEVLYKWLLWSFVVGRRSIE